MHHHQPYPHHPQQNPYPPPPPAILLEMDHPHHMQQLPYGSPMPPQPRGPSHRRSHSRSNSAVYGPPPPHGSFPGPHHEMAPPPAPAFQGHGSFHIPPPPPSIIAPPPEPIPVESRHHARSHSQSMPMPMPMSMSPYPQSSHHTNDPSTWSVPPPQHPSTFGPPSDQHLHQRPPHHPHPYHPSQPASLSRPPSRSHSRTHSRSQPQFAPQHAILSPPPPRHASPSVPVVAPRYPQEMPYPERVDPVRFPAPTSQHHPMQRPPMAEEEEENDGEVVQDATLAPRRASAQSASIVDEDNAFLSKCPDCGKMYKHATSLLKHRWEHSIYWKPATKFLLSKHQQVQLMEAASILLGMDESRDGDKDAIVSMFIKQRGQLATGTSTASASPPTSTKSLSGSPPPMSERAMAISGPESGSMMSPPQAYHGSNRVSNMATRHSVTSTTSTASSLSSTPPSLAPDDESVAEMEEDGRIRKFEG
ncbi:hypothetical protein BGZ54_001672 [Gamsiella multidivaricata]|nr:hypothetical protein BGZ54_001672 [Gamsiella multidivaricata]